MRLHRSATAQDPDSTERAIAWLKAHPEPDRVIFRGWDGEAVTPATMLQEVLAGSDKGKRYLDMFERGLRRVSEP